MVHPRAQEQKCSHPFLASTIAVQRATRRMQKHADRVLLPLSRLTRLLDCQWADGFVIGGTVRTAAASPKRSYQSPA